VRAYAPARSTSAGPLLAALLLLAAPPAPAQEPVEAPEAVLREVQAAQEALARAVAEFEGPQQGRSIVVFDEVIGRLEGLGVASLPPRGRDLLVQAYEYRGRAYFGIGLTEKAAENFRSLVQLKPDHGLSRDQVSPKVVEQFNSVKRALVGYLAVATEPAGARVVLVGSSGRRTDLGLTDFFPTDVLAGEYTVEISRPGYQTETRPLGLAARATESLESSSSGSRPASSSSRSRRGSRSGSTGSSRRPPRAASPPSCTRMPGPAGIDPARASARVEVANLSLGTHVVELRRRCHETVRRTIDTAQPPTTSSTP
jgi:hypothetical protein